MKMMNECHVQERKITGKSNVTIPKYFMKKMRLKEGEVVNIRLDGHRIILEKIFMGRTPCVMK